MVLGSKSLRMASSASLTDDILIEIFAYLPLNSIYKFRCLSKVWLSNLSSPKFITQWFRINNKSLPWIQYHMIVDNGNYEYALQFRKAYTDIYSEFMSRNDYGFSFKFLMNGKPFQGAKLYLLGSSNGLVLCYTLHLNCQRWTRRYHVCNPLTHKWVSIPSPPPSGVSSDDVHGICCEYSSSFSSHYKVVRIPKFNSSSKKFKVDVFSSDLGVWESFHVSCDAAVKGRWSTLNNVVILNSVISWIEGRKIMLAYNFKSDGHHCSLIKLPDEVHVVNDFDSILGESEGCVCCARIRWTETRISVSVWALDELNWQIFHNDVSIDSILAEMRSRIGEIAKIQVLGFSPIDRNVVLLGCKHVWAVNIKTRRFEELCLDNRQHYTGRMYSPFVLAPMPTVLPPHS